jgi:hypothetical protein
VLWKGGGDEVMRETLDQLSKIKENKIRRQMLQEGGSR